MGHNAFVERYNRPNYKIHVIIFLAIAGISIFLSTQVEKKRDNTDVAALKAPVPIDSIAIDKDTTQQIQPTIKPPVVTQNASMNSASESIVISETVQEYTFEDTTNLENITTLLATEDTQVEPISATLAVSMNAEASVTTDEPPAVEEPASQLSEAPATQVAKEKENAEAESPLSLDQVFQKQNDRFLETLAKTAQVEPEESVEIKQMKEAIRSDKPLASKKVELATAATAASANEEKKSNQLLTAANTTPVSFETKHRETRQVVVKQNSVNTQFGQTRNLSAKAQPASQLVTSAGASNVVASQSQIKSVETIVMTKGELDNVVNQFTNSYNEGDIDRLMALFAENARTNDQLNKLGIEADYAELFNNTHSRKLMINDINWQFGKGKAEGAAEFVVTVHPKNGLEENSFRGHIKITAIKQSKGVYITRLLHELKQ